MARRNELVAHVEAAPLEDEAYLIYGDWLQTQGDPRGELIALDASLARLGTFDERRLVRGRRAELFTRHPDLVPPRSPDVRLEWHLGFVRTVTIHELRPELRANLATLFAHPSLAFVTAVNVLSWHPLEAPRLADVIALAPATLRSLQFGERGRPFSTFGDRSLELHAIFNARPQLEQLASSYGLSLGPTPALRSLELADVTLETLQVLAHHPFTTLETLSLQFTAGYSRTAAPRPSQVADVLPLLRADLPRLTSLTLNDVQFGDDLVRVLATTPLLRQLRQLRLWNAGLTAEGAKHVTAEAYGHLHVLDLWDAGLDDAVAQTLAGACREVRTIPPRFRATRPQPTE